MFDLVTSLWIAGMVVIGLFAVIPSKLELSRRIILMVCLAGVGILSYRSINSRAGTPTRIPVLDSDQTLVISHYKDTQNNLIYIWIKRAGDTSPKTYMFGFNKQIAQKLDGLRSKNKGKPYYIKMRSYNEALDRLMETENTGIVIDEKFQMPKKDR